MSCEPLDNLAGIGRLKAEAYAQAEYKGLVESARKRLADARNESLSPESRFDLAYNASHAYALAALRYSGFRSENRYLVFQVLEHTVGMAPGKWRVLAKAHHDRNLAEYEGQIEAASDFFPNSYRWHPSWRLWSQPFQFRRPDRTWILISAATIFPPACDRTRALGGTLHSIVSMH